MLLPHIFPICSVVRLAIGRHAGTMPRSTQSGHRSVRNERFFALTRTICCVFMFVAFVFSWPSRSDAQTGAADFPAPVEGDFVARDFRFGSGETLPALNLHYRTIGTPRRDASGVVRNAVLILHGTGGTGEGFLSRTFGGELFGPGQLLDATRYFIILPDGIGHGKSSKPSDGLRARFPKYTYDDMVRAQHTLLVDGLKVDHLRLVLGTSMGAMHCWVWGEMYPDFVDGLVPLASVPTQIAGRNRVMRKMIMDSITQDPDWKNGDYTRAAAQGARRRGQPPDDDDEQPAPVAQVRRRPATRRTSGTRIRSRRAWPRPTRTTCCTSSTRRATTIPRRTWRRSRPPCSPSTRRTMW